MRILVTLSMVLFSTLPVFADTYVYLSIAAEKRIAIYQVNEKTGRLEHRYHVPVAGEPGPLATSPRRRFLFASIRSTGQLASFHIDARTGRLTHRSTIPAGADPAYVATDRTGNYLLSAYYRAGKVAVHRIRNDGTLQRDPVHSVQTAEKAHAILTDRTNRFAYVPHTGPNLIFQFRFDSETGRLTPNRVRKVATGENTGPRHLAIHPQLDVVYFDNERGSSVTAFRLETATGRLKPFQTLSTLPKDFHASNSCARLELSPSGRFLYAANRGHDSIAGFAVDAKTGRLTSLGQTPTEATPRSFNIDPSGRYLYAAGQSSGKLAAFRIDAETGSLQRFATYPVGQRPWWVLVVALPQSTTSDK